MTVNVNEGNQPGVATSAEGTPNTTPNQPESTPPKPETNDLYDADFVNKMLKEKRNTAELNKKLLEENKQLKEAELKRTENYKLIAEEKEKEALDWKAKYESKDKIISDSLKMSAVKKELTKLGCNPQYLDKAAKYANIENIDYDAETGVVTGHQEIAKLISEDLRPLFGNQNVGVSQGAPAGTPAPLTKEAYLALPYEERKKRREEFYAQQGMKRTR